MRPKHPFFALIAALVAAGTLGWSSTLVAQDVTVRAYLTPGATVGVGASFVVNVTVQGAQSLDQDPQPPDLSAFAQYMGSGSSTSMQVVNGRSSVSVTLQYRFQALKEGTFEIPGVSVRAGGSTHRTEPIRLTVSAAPAGSGGGQPSAGGGGNTGGALSPEDLFVSAKASRSRVMEGEPVVVEYRIWSRVDVTSYGFTDVPDPAGFLVKELGPEGQPQVEHLDRNGQTYLSAVIRRVSLIPTGAGKKTVTPLGIQAAVRIPRAGDPFDGLFGGSSLFARPTTVTVLSNPVTIEVDPLPPGKPEPFSGVVGSLDVTAAVDRDSVAVNEAVTLTVKASGQGNVGGVPAPSPELSADFQIFPPTVTRQDAPDGAPVGGSKTFEFVLIPRAPGTLEIPAISMGYYDAAARAYRVARTPAIPLTVTGTAATGPGAGTRSGVATMRQDIRFIHLDDQALRRVAPPLFQQWSFWLLLLLPLSGVGGAAALRRHQDRLVGDVAYARGRRAGRVARKRLAAARRLSTEEDPRPFYAEVARALRGFVADKLNVAEAGMQTGELPGRLRKAAVSDATVGNLERCLEECDRMRFAPPAPGGGETARFLDEAGALMTALDKEIRR